MTRTGKRRGRTIAIIAGIAVLAVAAPLALGWKRVRVYIHALRTGYEFIEMPEGILPDDDINDRGECAANFEADWPISRAGRWSTASRSFQPLGALPGDDPLSSAFAINERGCVVGNAYSKRDWLGLGQIGPSFNRRAFIWTPEGGMEELPSLGGNTTMPADINERNQVVGTATFPPLHRCRAVLWEPGAGIRVLGVLVEEGESFAVAINERGWVAGNATAADGSTHPVLWKPETGMMDISLPPSFGFADGYAVDINERGEVLVNYQEPKRGAGLDSYQPSRAFIYSDEKGYTPLPSPPGYEEIDGFDLTDSGIVLLTARRGAPSEWAYFLVRSGELIELPRAPGGEVTRYFAVNDRALIQ